MHYRRLVELDDEGRCCHELEYMGSAAPPSTAGLMDVTARTDGPWLGKVYDAGSDTFSYPAPTASLTVSESSIESGGTVALRWETAHAVRAEIDQGVGEVTPAAGGEVEVSPAETTTYTLTATGRDGTTTATASVTVRVSEPQE